MMDQMILGQILNKLNTLEELILMLNRKIEAMEQPGGGENTKLDELLTGLAALQSSVTGVGEKTDLLSLQTEQMDNKVETIVCSYPNQDPKARVKEQRITKKEKGEKL